jgi:hypothetical protein
MVCLENSLESRLQAARVNAELQTKMIRRKK